MDSGEAVRHAHRIAAAALDRHQVTNGDFPAPISVPDRQQVQAAYDDFVAGHGARGCRADAAWRGPLTEALDLIGRLRIVLGTLHFVITDHGLGSELHILEETLRRERTRRVDRGF